MNQRAARPTGRFGRALATVATLVLVSATAVAVAPGTAGAMCYGNDAGTLTIVHYQNGPVGQERSQRASTCDGLSDYYGRVYDIFTDGSCVYSHFWDPSRTTQGTSCNTSGANYSFWDPQGDSIAYWQLCTTYVCRNGPPGSSNDTTPWNY
jgi:hypothetical protein